MNNSTGFVSLATGLAVTIVGVVFSAGKLFQRTQENKEELDAHKLTGELSRKEITEKLDIIRNDVREIAIKVARIEGRMEK